MVEHGTSNAHPERTASRAFRILVVGEQQEVEAVEHVLRETLPDVSCHQAHTLSAGCEVLKREDVDVVLMLHPVPDGSKLDLLRRLGEHGVDVPVVLLTESDGAESGVVGPRSGAKEAAIGRPQKRYVDKLPALLRRIIQQRRGTHHGQAPTRHETRINMLETMRSTVATVKHEINNPLAIISGNAQLLMELARAMDLDDDFIKPIRDIDEASNRIAQSLDKLESLKDIMTREYVRGDGNFIDLSEE